jgi:hypothetical protein
MVAFDPVAEASTAPSVQPAVLASHSTAVPLAAQDEVETRLVGMSGGWYGVDPARDGNYGKPYRFVGKIEVLWKDGHWSQGTGFLVGRSHVMTAAHVVYNIDRKESPVAVMFTPGEYFGRAPFGSANAVKWAVCGVPRGNKMYDYAVIAQSATWRSNAGMVHTGRVGAMLCRPTCRLLAAVESRKVDANARVGTYLPYRYPDLRWATNDIMPLGGASGSPLFFSRVGDIASWAFSRSHHWTRVPANRRREAQSSGPLRVAGMDQPKVLPGFLWVTRRFEQVFA